MGLIDDEIAKRATLAMVWYKNTTKGNYNADLDRRPYREVDRRSYSVAVSTGVGRVLRVQLLTVPRRVGLVTYLG